MDKAAVREHVDRAASMLDQMLSSIMRDMFVDQAASYVTDERPELEYQQAIRAAVSERIEVLDANFLAALNAYIQAARARQEAGLCELLEGVRDEVLRQVAQRLPPAARVMEAAMQQVDKDRRLEVLRWCLFGESSHAAQAAEQAQTPAEQSANRVGAQDTLSSLPLGVSADEVMTSLTQLIDDMEEQAMVADRRLLSRMCLLREEVRWLDQECAFTQGDPAAAGEASLAAKFARRNVPQRCIAFLKELLRVADSSQRVALLMRALSEDWEGAAPTSAADRQKDAASGEPYAPDFVRPGRFMMTLLAVETQMQEAVQQGAGAAATQDPQHTHAVLQRLGDIRMESVMVLDRIQRAASTQLQS